MLLKKGKAGSQDIGRDSLFRFQELAVRLLAGKNDVANDQERPPVAEDRPAAIGLQQGLSIGLPVCQEDLRKRLGGESRNIVRAVEAMRSPFRVLSQTFI